jgi:hypothetical protein
VRKFPAIALAGVAAAALAGSAIAASPKTHVMNVPLPDGSVARVEYVGNVAPKVTVAPAPSADGFWMGGMPSFANFDRMFERMNRQMRAIEQMARQPAGIPSMSIASYGNMPAGANSVSVVSYSNGGTTCTRTTEVTSQGPGKPPKVVSSASGNCGPATAPAPSAAPTNPV